MVLKITGRPDPVINLSINPGYSIATNMMPQIGTVRKGDTVTLAGRDLDAGSMKVEPACVAIAGRTANSLKLQYNCEVQSGFQGTLVTVKMFPNVPAAQRCELAQDWRIANFDANAKPDLTPALDQFGSNHSARSRPAAITSTPRSAATCRRRTRYVTASSIRPTARCATSTADRASRRLCGHSGPEFLGEEHRRCARCANGHQNHRRHRPQSW